MLPIGTRVWSFTRKPGRDLVNSNFDCDSIRNKNELRDSFFLGCYVAIHSPVIFDCCSHNHGNSENSRRQTKAKTLCFPSSIWILSKHIEPIDPTKEKRDIFLVEKMIC